MPSDLIPTMQASLDDRVAELKAHPFDVLRNLPDDSDQQITAGKRTFTLATWTQITESQHIHVVVQAYYHHFLGLGTMIADGFTCTPDDQILPLPEVVRLDYC